MKYLFTALFEDGATIQQTSEDKSSINPLKSTFYDVLEKEKTSKLIMFSLSDSENNNFYLINLINGIFEINGVNIYFNDKDYYGYNNRVIYYRSRGIQFSENGPTNYIPEIYNIGFQTNNSAGKNIKEILQIKENGDINFILE